MTDIGRKAANARRSQSAPSDTVESTKSIDKNLLLRHRWMAVWNTHRECV